MVATPVCVEVQQLVTALLVPSLLVATAENCWVSPCRTVAFDGLTPTATTIGAVMVMVVVPLVPPVQAAPPVPLRHAVMVDVPLDAFATARPRLPGLVLMGALALLENHPTCWVKSKGPPEL